ncbi:MAG: chemotaxis protein CheW, partial [Spirochaetales bacterium]|nr:chemotaxis protein CheW [Spirochaetales bacterium]
MATIQDKLSILASTTETADSNISSSQLDEEKKKVAAIDYKMVTFSLSGKDYAVDIMKVKE